jgi:hypothetical protein
VAESRKIFNFESKISEEKTLEKFGYSPDIFGVSSAKFVIATCRYCGEYMEVRKGFFNKAGSACHRDCQRKEMKQQKSPFLDKKVREKAKKTNLERYGAENANQSEEIKKKMTDILNSEEVKQKRIDTNLEKYGVENVFQSEEIKERIEETLVDKYGVKRVAHIEGLQDQKRKTNLQKYGVSNPMQNEEVKEKAKQTNLEKYGVENPLQNKEIQEKSKKTNLERYGTEYSLQNEEVRNKIKESQSITIEKDENGYFKTVNILRSDIFWKKMEEGLSYSDLSKEFDLNFNTLKEKLSQEEFKYKRLQYYTYPTLQTQREVYNEILNMDSSSLFNDRDTISPLELDIFVKDRNVAIEYNGSYWHSEITLDRNKARSKHFNKTNICLKKGIRLIHVFEHNYIGREQKYLDFIRSAINANEHRIFARKCEISEENSTEFIKTYHLQEAASNSTKYFSLTYNGEIVGSISLGPHHEKAAKTNSIILNRLCFKANYTVTGGFSKLMKYIKLWAKKEGYDKIITWSDNALTDGHAYAENGFVLEDEYGPSYFYYDKINEKYVNKQSMRKHNKLRPDGITILDWNKQKELYAIWDCGKKKWTITL